MRAPRPEGPRRRPGPGSRRDGGAGGWPDRRRAACRGGRGLPWGSGGEGAGLGCGADVEGVGLVRRCCPVGHDLSGEGVEVGCRAARGIERVDGEPHGRGLTEPHTGPDHGVEQRAPEACVEGDQQLTREALAAVEQRPDDAHGIGALLALPHALQDAQGLQGTLEREGPRLDDEEGARAREEGVGAEDTVRPGRAVEHHEVVAIAHGVQGVLQPLLRVEQALGGLLELDQPRTRGEQVQAERALDDGLLDVGLLQ